MNDSFSFYLDDSFIELMQLAALSTCISWCSLHQKNKNKKIYTCKIKFIYIIIFKLTHVHPKNNIEHPIENLKNLDLTKVE